MTLEENIRAMLECNFTGYKDEIIDIATKSIMSLSDIENQKTGHWIDIRKSKVTGLKIVKCSECGYEHSFMHLYGKPTSDYTYCPNCGAKMEGENK